MPFSLLSPARPLLQALCATTALALAAAPALALERGRERQGGVGAPTARRAGEEPRVRHRSGHRLLEPLDDRALTDEPVPHGHAVLTSFITSVCTDAATSSTGARASSTR